MDKSNSKKVEKTITRPGLQKGRAVVASTTRRDFLTASAVVTSAAA